MTQFKHKSWGDIVTVEDGKVIDMPARFLTDEWEEYEEPKDFWFVDADGEARETNYLSDNDKSGLREFGNYFLSREEAEKAVKRLCAWKRLKDKGIEISHYDFEDNKYETTVEVILDIPPLAWDDKTKQDLDTICRGGE